MDSQTRVTIKDIAREAHVGTGTVSRALNNSPGISPTTRERILRIVRKYHFQPNPLAAKLGTKSNSACYVGLIVKSFLIKYFLELFESIDKVLLSSGAHLLVLEYSEGDRQADGRSLLISQIQELTLSGIIFFSVCPGERELSILRSRNIPFLFLDPERKQEGVSITSDNLMGGHMAARYLASRGVLHPSYVSRIGDSIDDTRKRGFAEELASLKLPAPVLYSCDWGFENAEEVGEQILREGRTDGVFCFCDDIAIGLLRLFRKKQAKMPIIGFDGIREGEGWGLSTISQNPELLGGRVAEEILSLMESQSTENKEIVIVPTLVDRGS